MHHRLLVASGFLLVSIVACNRAEPTATETTSTDASPTSELGGAMRTDPDPVVVLLTTQGTIKLRLNPAKAPLTVDNFLAQVESGYYNQMIFHEVEPNYVILAGGFRANLTEKKTRYSIRNESNNGLSNRRGTVAMARAVDGMDSDTGQFFVNVADNQSLDYQGDTAEQCGYCVFGEVVEGLDVAERISQLKTQSVGDLAKLPVETVLIDTATKQR